MISAKTRQAAAAERIRQAIMEGRYRPGQRLKQRELAQEFGCSIIPIREAFYQLAVEGFVVLDAQKGVRVTDLDSQRVEETYEIRVVLEGLAARRAAERMTDNVAERLRTIQEKLDDVKTSSTEWISLNWEFHDTLYSCAQQKLLTQMIFNLRQSLEPYLRLDLAKVADFERRRDEHRKIFEACLRGDARAAQRYTEAHLRHGARRLVEYLRRYGK
jgi:DNA-binding GntR family transcriptional regulator